MRYLLDTHVFLWLRAEPERLRGSTRARLARAENELLLSAASAWELVVKQATGRMSLPGPVRSWLPDAAAQLNCAVLAIELEHAIEGALLPHHHRDPFDRLIVGQARIEGLTLVTSDKALARYDVEILRA